MAKHPQPRPSNQTEPTPRVAPMKRNVTVNGTRYLCELTPPEGDATVWKGRCVEEGVEVSVEADGFVQVDNALQDALRAWRQTHAAESPETPSETPQTEAPSDPSPGGEAAEAEPAATEQPSEAPQTPKRASKRKGKKKSTPKTEREGRIGDADDQSDES